MQEAFSLSRGVEAYLHYNLHLEAGKQRLITGVPGGCFAADFHKTPADFGTVGQDSLPIIADASKSGQPLPGGTVRTHQVKCSAETSAGGLNSQAADSISASENVFVVQKYSVVVGKNQTDGSEYLRGGRDKANFTKPALFASDEVVKGTTTLEMSMKRDAHNQLLAKHGLSDWEYNQTLTHQAPAGFKGGKAALIPDKISEPPFKHMFGGSKASKGAGSK
jgi:hypothetical protein